LRAIDDGTAFAPLDRVILVGGPMRQGSLALMIVCLAAVPDDAVSQEQRGIRELEGRCCTVGLYGTLARPIGEFQRYVDLAGGLGGYWLTYVDRNRVLGLRVEGSWMLYGYESYTVPFGPNVGRVLIDVNTTNMIAGAGLGPQLAVDWGRLRPYVYGTVGFSYFATVSSVEGGASAEPFAETTNFDDFTFTAATGAGTLVRLSRGRRLVWLDLSVEQRFNGEADYLREGGIIENGDGSIAIVPIRSDTDLMSFRLGIAIGF
jgi:hypothetical protein